mmetsp:Transcript_82354/g.236636  ORF Transcript_82354/g.236636 Transcript_82354/m.236636 type:complete len:240 (+) Transcript_82354:318-1037(+)
MLFSWSWSMAFKKSCQLNPGSNSFATTGSCSTPSRRQTAPQLPQAPHAPSEPLRLARPARLTRLLRLLTFLKGVIGATSSRSLKCGSYSWQRRPSSMSGAAIALRRSGVGAWPSRIAASTRARAAFKSFSRRQVSSSRGLSKASTSFLLGVAEAGEALSHSSGGPGNVTGVPSASHKNRPVFCSIVTRNSGCSSRFKYRTCHSSRSLRGAQGRSIFDPLPKSSQSKKLSRLSESCHLLQ